MTTSEQRNVTEKDIWTSPPSLEKQKSPFSQKNRPYQEKQFRQGCLFGFVQMGNVDARAAIAPSAACKALGAQVAESAQQGGPQARIAVVTDLGRLGKDGRAAGSRVLFGPVHLVPRFGGADGRDGAAGESGTVVPAGEGAQVAGYVDGGGERRVVDKATTAVHRPHSDGRRGQ